MLRTPGLLAVIRRNLLQREEPLDPFGPLDDPFPPRRQPVQPLSLVGPVGPRAANRRDDVSRVARTLERAGFAEPGAAAGDVFDARLEDGIRRFQRRHGLAVDGLLNPGGPTERMINDALEAPAASLTGEALSANTRLVRHLMTTTEDGLVPALLASDFRSDAAARAKSVDLFAQLFLRDPVRARDLREKAGAEMSADDAGLLDQLILAARRAEVERPRPGDAEEPDDPDGPGDPDNPPGDPGKPDEPGRPDKPTPDKEQCARLQVQLANAEQARKEALERAREADAESERWQEESKRLSELLKRKLAQLALEAAVPLMRSRRLGGASTAAEVTDLKQKLEEAQRRFDEALQARKVEEAEAAAREEEIEELREQMAAAGCG